MALLSTRKCSWQLELEWAQAGMVAFLGFLLLPSDKSALHLDRLSNQLPDQQDKDGTAEVDNARVRLPVVSDQRGDDPLEDSATPLQRRGCLAQRFHDGRRRFSVRFAVSTAVECVNFVLRRQKILLRWLFYLQENVSEDPDVRNTLPTSSRVTSCHVS